MSHARAARSTLLVLLGVLACASESPFTRTPEEIAVDEPCRFMGTMHKESRGRLEMLRLCHAISMDEWACMTDALKAVDREFTGVCRSRAVAYPEIAQRKREAYAACLGYENTALVECALLSTDVMCLADFCE